MHHSFSVELAEEFGIEEAIIIHHFQHWINLNRDLKKGFIEGRTWTLQSQEWIAAHFPYMNGRKSIMRIIQILIEKKVLIKGNFNKKNYDKTQWYAFVDEGRFLKKIASQKVDNGLSKSCQPIPDTKKDNKEITTTGEASLLLFSSFEKVEKEIQKEPSEDELRAYLDEALNSNNLVKEKEFTPPNIPPTPPQPVKKAPERVKQVKSTPQKFEIDLRDSKPVSVNPLLENVPIAHPVKLRLSKYDTNVIKNALEAAKSAKIVYNLPAFLTTACYEQWKGGESKSTIERKKENEIAKNKALIKKSEDFFEKLRSLGMRRIKVSSREIYVFIKEGKFFNLLDVRNDAICLDINSDFNKNIQNVREALQKSMDEEQIKLYEILILGHKNINI